MSRKRVIAGIAVEESHGSVYAGLGLADSADLEIKARLVTEITGILKRRRLTQRQAAEILGLTQPKISRLLKGQFRGISEHRLLDCLTRLGRDVEIRVKPAAQNRDAGQLSVHFF